MCERKRQKTENKLQDNTAHFYVLSLHINNLYPLELNLKDVTLKFTCGECKDPCVHMPDCTVKTINIEFDLVKRKNLIMFWITSLDQLVGKL